MGLLNRIFGVAPDIGTIHELRGRSYTFRVVDVQQGRVMFIRCTIFGDDEVCAVVQARSIRDFNAFYKQIPRLRRPVTQ